MPRHKSGYGRPGLDTPVSRSVCAISVTKVKKKKERGKKLVAEMERVPEVCKQPLTGVKGRVVENANFNVRTVGTRLWSH